MLKVHELIELLSKMPQDAVVAVHGYEDGYDDIGDVQTIDLSLYSGDASHWWNGVYEKNEDGNITAVLISDSKRTEPNKHYNKKLCRDAKVILNKYKGSIKADLNAKEEMLAYLDERYGDTD